MDVDCRTGITEEAIAFYDRAGAICLRGFFGAEWVERLGHAIDRLTERPGPLAEIYGAAEGKAGFYGDRFVWTFDPDFRAFALDSAAGAIMARLMRSSTARLYCDHVLVKEPGTMARTPWHHDLQAWPIEGWQIGSLWLALDEATVENGAVEYVAGSHRWGKRFRSDAFGRAGRGGETFAALAEEEYECCPDIDAERARHELLCWEMAPGDCVVFHALTVHGAPGNATERRRRALSTRWAGDDVRWIERKGRTAKLIRDPGLAPGDKLDGSELFPLVWSAHS
jgi:ectoine hydroxylase-related dioxygenase (phytanoyl-CoA dioxygenase family)